MVFDGALERATDVVVCLSARGADTAADHALLGDLLAWAAGVDRGTVDIVRSCAHCGGTGHGQPLVRSPAGAHVSLSRAGGRVAVAVTFAGPLGIDLEGLDAVARAGFDDAAFSPAERARLGRGAGPRAALWTAKEAVLKATGRGLRVDPRELTLAAGTGAAGPRLLAWPDAGFELGRLHLAAFDSGAGLAGCVAVLSRTRPRVVVVPASVLDQEPRGGGDAVPIPGAGSELGQLGGVDPAVHEPGDRAALRVRGEEGHKVRR